MRANKVLDGNTAVSEAVRQLDPDVVMAYPSAPGAPMLERLAMDIANGSLDTELVNMESPQSAISGCIGASAAGGRVFSSASSQELAQMHEMLFIASSLRLPIVIGIADRALSAPINYYADHSDAMAERDCGWIQLFCESPQEAYDNIIQAYKISEHQDVKTPVMVAMDGWITSHTMENVSIEEPSEITDFMGKRIPTYSLLNSTKPLTIGSFSSPNYYFEHKLNQFQGMENSRKIIREVGKEFGDRFGRYYGYFETYKLDDAEYGIIIMSSAAGTAKEAIDRLRSRGEKVGLLKLRVFRPFPFQEIQERLLGLKAIAIFDRNIVPGSQGGPLYNEIRSAMYFCEDNLRPKIFPYIFGLGGRELNLSDIDNTIKEIKEKTEKVESENGFHFVNVRYRQVNNE